MTTRECPQCLTDTALKQKMEGEVATLLTFSLLLYCLNPAKLLCSPRLLSGREGQYSFRFSSGVVNKHSRINRAK